MAHRNTGGRAAPASSRDPSPNDRATSGPNPSTAEPSLTLCVFCGSSPGRDPSYAAAAKRLGTLIGEGGHRLVFGGGNVGLMGEVARAARDAGASVIGILPAFLRHLEPPLDSAEEVVITPDLQLRKSRMLALADAFVILPGGLGTLDEYFEVVTTAQLSVHAKPIVVVDVGGFYAPLEKLLTHIVAEGFARPEIAHLHRLVRTPDEAMAAISSLPSARRA